MLHVNFSGSARHPIGSFANPNLHINQGLGYWIIWHNNNEVQDRLNLWNISSDTCQIKDIDRIADILGGNWKIKIVTPFWNATWERICWLNWKCIETGYGFSEY